MGSKRLVPAAGVRLRILDEEGVLFDRRGQMAYFLNTSATLLWCRIESGDGSPAAVAGGGGATTAAGHGDSEQEIIRRWVALGLLVQPDAPPPSKAPAAPRRRSPRARKLVPAPSGQVAERHYRLLRTEFALAFGGAGLSDLVHPILAHLERAAPAEAPLTIAIDVHRGRFRLSEGGRLLDTCRSPDEVAPLVKLHLARLAVARQPHRLALHAATLAKPEGCLMLPAAAGSGKSVVTAALMARGWEYLSDDTALLGQDFAVTGAPYSLTIKEGAWTVVAAWFPRLLRQAVHRRPDGERVRYLSPVAAEAASGQAERRLRWIVSPRFAGAVAPAALARLSRAEALQLLLAHCSSVRPLGGKTIDRMIEWLRSVESYRLDYSSADAAVAVLESLAAKGG